MSRHAFLKFTIVRIVRRNIAVGTGEEAVKCMCTWSESTEYSAVKILLTRHGKALSIRPCGFQ